MIAPPAPHCPQEARPRTRTRNPPSHSYLPAFGRSTSPPSMHANVTLTLTHSANTNSTAVTFRRRPPHLQYQYPGTGHPIASRTHARTRSSLSERPRALVHPSTQVPVHCQVEEVMTSSRGPWAVAVQNPRVRRYALPSSSTRLRLVPEDTMSPDAREVVSAFIFVCYSRVSCRQ